jgi:beta-fructofuranosidase
MHGNEDNTAHDKTGSGAAAELDRFAESRRRLAADPWRPLYHFVSPERTLNDPNGLCFWQGKWHLFYQAQPAGDDRTHWGHAVSDDLIHWRDLPYALRPGPEERCFSGSILVEPARAIAIYHGVGAGTMAATASDPLLLDWTKVGGKPVIPCPVMWQTNLGPEQLPGWQGNPAPKGALNLIYDPCIWKKGDSYYALTGGALPHPPSGRRLRTPFLFRSRDLARWEYLHPFTEGDVFGLPGDDFGCPYFWPIGDRHILLHFSHMSGAHYLIGDYDTARDKFVATQGGHFTFGPAHSGNVHAPSATPDGTGGLIAFFNVNAAKPTPGWDQLMSLPRRLTLIGRDELGQEPAGDIASLRQAHRRIDGLALPANREVVLDGVSGNAIEFAAEIDTQGAQMIELNVLRSPGREEVTRIAFYRGRGFVDWLRSEGWTRYWESCDSLITLDTSYSSELPDAASRAPETAPVFLAPGEPLKLRVFIDRSIVEVFVNGRQCVAARVYPGRPDSLGISLRAQGADATLRALDAWTMKGIYNVAGASCSGTGKEALT